MACNGGPSSYRIKKENKKKKDQVQKARDIEALACAAFTFIINEKRFSDFVDSADWDEAGVSSEYAIKWWEKHKKADEERRKSEETKRITKLNKLTPAQLKKLDELLDNL